MYAGVRIAPVYAHVRGAIAGAYVCARGRVSRPWARTCNVRLKNRFGCFDPKTPF